MRNISVLGLGRIGLPTAAVLISKGYKVTGVDVNEDVINKINKGKSPIYEPGVEEALQSFGGNLYVTTQLEPAIEETDISLVVLPTPSTPEGNFSLEYFLPVCREIGELLKDKTNFHVVAVLSTVMPGDMFVLQKVIEDSSGKKCGKDFGLCYVPEFIALGTVMENILRPQFVVIGESDVLSGNVLESLYEDMCKEPIFVRTNFVNAELAKIALNVYVTMKISFANTLTEVCEKLPEANVDVITSTIGLDNRIGIKFLKGAMSYGGRCFPRDNRSFNYVAQRVGVEAPLNKASDEVNDRQQMRVLDMVCDYLPYNGAASVLGVAFKSLTEDTTESPGLQLAERLAQRGVKVCVYDPLIEKMDLGRILKENMSSAFIAETCVRDADVTIIANPCEEFKDLEPKLFKKGSVVIDCWRILDKFKKQDRVKYIQIGIGND